MTPKTTFLLILFALGLASFEEKENARTLVVDFKNLKYPNATIFIAVNEPNEKFPHENKVVRYLTVNPQGNAAVRVEIPNLEYGNYALTVFQDLNNNGKIDKGFLGIPVEPFAFSNNYRPVFRAPRWEDCEFNFSRQNTHLEITQMIKML